MGAKRELYNVEGKEYLRCIKCGELKDEPIEFLCSILR